MEFGPTMRVFLQFNGNIYTLKVAAKDTISSFKNENLFCQSFTCSVKSQKTNATLCRLTLWFFPLLRI